MKPIFIKRRFAEKSQAPFISDRADMNLKWLRLINEIAKEALGEE